MASGSSGVAGTVLGAAVVVRVICHIIIRTAGLANVAPLPDAGLERVKHPVDARCCALSFLANAGRPVSPDDPIDGLVREARAVCFDHLLECLPAAFRDWLG